MSSMSRVTKLVAVVFFTIGLVLPVVSQSQGGARTFPTRLSIRPEGTSLIIGWSEFMVEADSFSIYRSRNPIQEDSFLGATRIGTVNAGVGEFRDDTTEFNVPYYYAVLAVEPSGEENRIFVPFSNTSIHSVIRPEFATPSLQRIEASVVEIVEIPDGIIVSIEPPSVVIRIQIPAGSERYLVYRHTSPITSSRSLVEAILLGEITPEDPVYRDTPLAGIPLYYAVLDSRSILGGRISLIPGENTTTDPVTLPDSATGGFKIPSSLVMRPSPLPALSIEELTGRREGLLPLETPVVLPPELSTSLEQLLESTPERPMHDLNPHLLPEEQNLNVPGERRLNAILRGEFLKGKWANTRILLSNYLRLRIPGAMKQRIYYYLGQAAYFAGDYPDALINFIFAEEGYFAESRPWIQNLVRELSKD